MQCDVYAPSTSACTALLSTLTNEQIVHRAVGILRERMSKREMLDEMYYSPDEMNLETMYKFVDPLLYKMIQWLTDAKTFHHEDASEEKSVKSLSIACDIMTKSTSVLSPKHLGIGVFLHHEYGSRKLVESLHSLGHCMWK